MKQILPDDLPQKERVILDEFADQSITNDYENILLNCFDMRNEIDVDEFGFNFLVPIDKKFREIMNGMMTSYFGNGSIYKRLKDFNKRSRCFNDIRWA